eukprot:8861243-Alexandrium_andersonii.AAC.1
MGMADAFQSGLRLAKATEAEATRLVTSEAIPPAASMEVPRYTTRVTLGTCPPPTNSIRWVEFTEITLVLPTLILRP